MEKVLTVNWKGDLVKVEEYNSEVFAELDAPQKKYLEELFGDKAAEVFETILRPATEIYSSTDSNMMRAMGYFMQYFSCEGEASLLNQITSMIKGAREYNEGEPELFGIKVDGKLTFKDGKYFSV